MAGSLLERYLLLVAGRLPAEEVGVLATPAEAAPVAAATGCFC